jgi:hypothetical protein
VDLDRVVPAGSAGGAITADGNQTRAVMRDLPGRVIGCEGNGPVDLVWSTRSASLGFWTCYRLNNSTARHNAMIRARSASMLAAIATSVART